MPCDRSDGLYSLARHMLAAPHVTWRDRGHLNLWPGSRHVSSYLTGSLKDAARQRFQTGCSNQALYAQLWKDYVPRLDAPASNAFWTLRQVTVPQIKQVLKVRYGQFWNMRRAFCLSMPYFRGGLAHDHLMSAVWRS